MTSNPLLAALRQYRHNQGEGFVFGYDKAETDRIVAKLVEALEHGFPLLSDEGLDEVEHHCEWVIQRERKRVHNILAAHRKPKTHIVNGVEIPDLRVSPKQGEYFYLADPLSRSLITVREHTKKLAVKEWVERGLVYQHSEEGKQAAILHSQAMLGIKP